MKRKLSLIAVLFQMLLAVTFFSSCDDSKTSESGKSLVLELNVACTKNAGKIHITAEPVFSCSPSELDLSVEEVQYYIDGFLCKTVTVSPYTFEYEPENWTDGRHNIRAKVILHSENPAPHNLSIEYTMDIPEPSENGLNMSLDLKYNTNGKHITLSAQPIFSPSPSELGMIVEKVIYWIDGKNIKAVMNSPYTFEYESDNWSAGQHNIQAVAQINGKDVDLFFLECSKDFDTSYVESKEADIWFDYNFTSTGDTFYISADVNKKRSPNVDIISMSVDWDGNKIGETFSAPFRIEKIITEPTGSKHEIKATVKYTQDGVESTRTFEIPLYEIVGTDLYEVTSFILKSSTKEYKNGEYLEAIAHVYPSHYLGYELHVYLDEKQIVSTRDFPNYQYEMSYLLSNLEPGKHIVKYYWHKISAGNISLGSPVEEEITIIE